MARAGLSNLIEYVRLHGNAGTADYSVAGVDYWSDDQIQDLLMQHHTRLTDVPLRFQPQIGAGGTTEYKLAYLPHLRGAIEGTASGDNYWKVYDSKGSVIPTSQYTVSFTYGTGTNMVIFNTSQSNLDLYVLAYAYNLPAAIALLWQSKAAHYSSYYGFKTNDQQFDRDKVFEHALKMVAHWRSLSGFDVGLLNRTDLSQPFNFD